MPTARQPAVLLFFRGPFSQFHPSNFTVDGLSDAEVCIGDRYRIGGALFEVTQPRVTCYRLGIRMNEPRLALPRNVSLTLVICMSRPDCSRGWSEKSDSRPIPSAPGRR